MNKFVPLPIVVKSGGYVRINTQVLPESCNKPDIINRLYAYMADNYSFTYGKFRISDINKDLTNLLKREGLI